MDIWLILSRYDIWLVFVLLSAVTVALLFWASRRLAAGPVTAAADAQIAIYKDQLAEIDADVTRGAMTPADADAHRTEVARRLLAVASPGEQPAGRRVWLLAVLALAVPLLAFGIYLRLGAPSFPDLPQAERLANAEKANDLEAMVYKVEQHLQKKPDDVSGWEVVLPTYKAIGRYSDAAAALRRLIALKGPTAELFADLSEMHMFAGNGLMPPEGLAAAREALKLDPKNSKARYYEALGLSQDGQRDAALKAFEAMLAEAPADAPWRGAVEKQIAEIKGGNTPSPGPTQEQVDAAAGMNADDQQAMIRSMVDGLAAKLESDPKNLDGWLRLIRARVVLKEAEAAQAALDKARSSFDGDQGALARLSALAQETGLK
jgi:cytochrome c-type biogenesis protein CcmH